MDTSIFIKKNLIILSLEGNSLGKLLISAIKNNTKVVEIKSKGFNVNDWLIGQVDSTRLSSNKC